MVTMKKDAVSAVLADGFWRQDPTYAAEIDAIEEARRALVRHLTGFIEKLDVSEKSNWKAIVAAALEAGVTDAELQRELGASPSTVHRWLQDNIAPREGTRRLMKGALLELMTRRREAPSSGADESRVAVY